MSRWISTTDPLDDSVPKLAGCYAIYFNKRLVYIGSTFNLRSRLQGHFKLPRYSNLLESKWGQCFDLLVKYRPTLEYGYWAMLELLLIRRLKPEFNKKRR